MIAFTRLNTLISRERPTWLANLHAAPDRVGLSAYGWDVPGPVEVPEDEILARQPALNLERAEPD